MQYSPQLIQKAKSYFNAKYGEVLSDEEVIERLNAYGDLVIVVATGNARKGDPSTD